MDEYTLKVADEVILSREATRLRHELDRVEAQLHAVQEWLREAEAEAREASRVEANEVLDAVERERHLMEDEAEHFEPLVNEPVPDWYGEDR